MRKLIHSVLPLVALSVLACSRKPSENSEQHQPPAPTVATASSVSVPSGATAPTPVASSAPVAIPEVAPVCTVESKKVWLKGANTLTGLTEATLADGRTAIGFAVGSQPRILLVTSGGKGSVVKVPIANASRLATMPKGATRHLLRVTPVKVTGEETQAFVDFEDSYKDGKRTVICGPADANENWVEFDGLPCDPPKNAKPEQVAALFPQQGNEKVCTEVRTCRTFTNLDRGETWVLSSNVHGVLQSDNSINWRSDLAVSTGSKAQKRILESSPVTDKTLSDEYYEIPVSHSLKSGSYLVAARHHNHLVVGVLGPDKSLVGKLSRYPGYPTLPDLADDGSDGLVLTTAFAKGKGEFGLRALRIEESKPELPKTMRTVVTDKTTDDNSSESDPDFLRDVQGRRWIAHIEGQRGSGKLSLAPVNANFQAIGRSYTITEGDEKAIIARLVPMKDKGILVVFLREADKTTELVTEEVHCKIEQ